ncbi:velvet factor-domain-containing protein [Trametes elegans]|nr:velvet factor-domain-containing protein [Trametes elegans]
MLRPFAEARALPTTRSIGILPGEPVAFATGFMAGHTIRAELEEIQKADHGRKYAPDVLRARLSRVGSDLRQTGARPPPVVLCRFFDVVRTPGGTTCEHDLDPDTAMLGTVCHVDLFPVPASCAEPGGYWHHEDEPDYGPPHPLLRPEEAATESASPSQSCGTVDQSRPRVQTPFAPPTQTSNVLPPLRGHIFNPETTSNVGLPTVRSLQSPSVDPDIVTWFRGYPVRESSKCTTLLSGLTVMQSSIIDHKGKKSAICVFSDLSVKSVGTFILRFRMFNVFSHRAAPPHQPALAECYGGAFRVHTTKDFPGLRPSTELTKLLSMYGLRVRLRENERKRRRKCDEDGDGGKCLGDRLEQPADAAERGDYGGPPPAPPRFLAFHSSTLQGARPGPARAPLGDPPRRNAPSSSPSTGYSPLTHSDCSVKGESPE